MGSGKDTHGTLGPSRRKAVGRPINAPQGEVRHNDGSLGRDKRRVFRQTDSPQVSWYSRFFTSQAMAVSTSNSHFPRVFHCFFELLSTADVLSLRTAHFSNTIRLGSMECVEVRWFHDRSSRDLPNSEELSVYMTLAFSMARETFVNPFLSPRKFFFYTDKIESIEWQDLVPRGFVSMIVSRFTSFDEDFSDPL